MTGWNGERVSGEESVEEENICKREMGKVKGTGQQTAGGQTQPRGWDWKAPTL